METMHAAGRRNLPPVPRPALDVPAPDVPTPGGKPEEPPAEQTMELHRRATQEDPGAAGESPAEEALADESRAEDDTTSFPPATDQPADDLESYLDPEVLAVADEPEHALDDDDPAQGFVSQLRAAATEFASAACARPCRPRGTGGRAAAWCSGTPTAPRRT